jgi:hypothetical protein
MRFEENASGDCAVTPCSKLHSVAIAVATAIDAANKQANAVLLLVIRAVCLSALLECAAILAPLLDHP